jgi:hypothetical protein
MVLPMALLCIQLTACGIGGHWMTGDPSAGRDVKPRLQYYEKPGWTPEERRRDSEACGAIGLDDRADLAESRIQAEQLPGEIERQTMFRLREAWLACIREKGYRGVHSTPK